MLSLSLCTCFTGSPSAFVSCQSWGLVPRLQESGLEQEMATVHMCTHAAQMGLPSLVSDVSSVSQRKMQAPESGMAGGGEAQWAVHLLYKCDKWFKSLEPT